MDACLYVAMDACLYVARVLVRVLVCGKGFAGAANANFGRGAKGPGFVCARMKCTEMRTRVGSLRVAGPDVQQTLFVGANVCVWVLCRRSSLSKLSVRKYNRWYHGEVGGGGSEGERERGREGARESVCVCVCVCVCVWF